jgi:hypothetical protein
MLKARQGKVRATEVTVGTKFHLLLPFSPHSRKRAL